MDRETSCLHQKKDTILYGELILTEGLKESIGFRNLTPTTGICFWNGHHEGSCIELPLGNFPHLQMALFLFRSKPWWMEPKVVSDINKILPETQLILGRLANHLFLFIVPLVTQKYRSSLKGENDQLWVVTETGDSSVFVDQPDLLLLGVGEDPYKLIRESLQILIQHYPWAALREAKGAPKILDKLGWCSWNAFYKKVTAEKVYQVLQSLQEGEIYPRWIILDDGWQQVTKTRKNEPKLEGFDTRPEFGSSLQEFVKNVKTKFHVDQVWVWHTIQGYWGGVFGKKLGYKTTTLSMSYSQGLLQHAPWLKDTKKVELIKKEDIYRFYHDFYRYLRLSGIDGVKVDNQSSLEAQASRQGGRVELIRSYREAMEGAAHVHLQGNVINCMGMGNDVVFQTLSTTLARTSDDFFPNDESSHVKHIYTNSVVSLFCSPIVWPDWDMFQSDHPWGAFHAAARAISGGPVYITDEPHKHNWSVLKKLVMDDGTLLRPQAPACPLPECLFVDPTAEDVLWKIFAPNRYGWVVGIFHCQYHANPQERHYLATSFSPKDIPSIPKGGYILYSHIGQKLIRTQETGKISIWLTENQFEIITVVKVENGFAPIGLADKYNSGGAILSWNDSKHHGIQVQLLGKGRFLAFIDRYPVHVMIDQESVPFVYDHREGRLEVPIHKTGTCTLTILRP